jgi:hypothetical protein
MLGLLGLGAGLLGSLFKHKGQQKQASNQRNAQIAGLNLQQNMGEDKRLARLNLAQSILGGIKSQPGSRVNYSGAIDPAVLAQLQQRRQYDFAPTVGDPNAGAGSGLLGSLFGGAGDLMGEIDFQRNQKRKPVTSAINYSIPGE